MSGREASDGNGGRERGELQDLLDLSQPTANAFQVGPMQWRG